MVTTHPITALRAIYGVSQVGLSTLSRGSVSAAAVSRLERGAVEPTPVTVAAICPPEIDPARLYQAILTYNAEQPKELAAFAAWLKGIEVNVDAIPDPSLPSRRQLFTRVFGGGRRG